MGIRKGGALEVINRKSYLALMIFKSDMEEVNEIKNTYNISKSDVVRSFVTRGLKEYDETGNIPLIKNDELVTKGSLSRFNFGPTIVQMNRLKEVASETGITPSHLVVIFIRSGVAAFKNNKFILEKTYQGKKA